MLHQEFTSATFTNANTHALCYFFNLAERLGGHAYQMHPEDVVQLQLLFPQLYHRLQPYVGQNLNQELEIVFGNDWQSLAAIAHHFPYLTIRKAAECQESLCIDEPLHNLAGHPKIELGTENLDDKYVIIDPRVKGKVYLRASVAQALIQILNILPQHCKLKIYESLRLIETQHKLFALVKNDFAKDNPQWTQDQLNNETEKWVAHPDKDPPHSTGGVFDLTIIKNGSELDMGSPINSINETSYTIAFLSPAAAVNRSLLIIILHAAGFINNPREWWHWGIGDTRGGAVLGKRPLYGPAKLPS